MELSKFKKFQSKYTRHPLFPFLKNYNFNAIAEELGCAPSWVRQVLYGYGKASKENDAKLYALADELRAAEAELTKASV